MLIISHRGNLDGPDPELENNPEQINKVITLGFDCEIDVWRINNAFYLGHDAPIHEVDIAFLDNEKFWIHAKNLAALSALKDFNFNVFYHNTDPYTLTSKKYIWTYPGENIDDKCIVVLRDKTLPNYKRIKGICTDYPLFFNKSGYE